MITLDDVAPEAAGTSSTVDAHMFQYRPRSRSEGAECLAEECRGGWVLPLARKGLCSTAALVPLLAVGTAKATATRSVYIEATRLATYDDAEGDGLSPGNMSSRSSLLALSVRSSPVLSGPMPSIRAWSAFLASERRRSR